MNLFLESWDYLDTTTQRFSDTGPSTPVVTAAVGRRSTGGCTGVDENYYGAYAVNASGTTIIVGAAVRFPTSSGYGKVFGFGNVTASGMENVYLQAFDDGSLGLYRRDGQVLGVSQPGVLALAGDYQYIEAKIMLASGVATAEVRVNTAPVIVLTGLTTSFSDLAPNRVWVYPQGRRYYDDMYVNDTRGSLNNDFEGDVRIDTHYPESDGDLAQWNRNTGSFQFDTVNEHPPDEDTTYNSTPITGNIDMLGLQNLIPVLAGVRSVCALIRAKGINTPAGSGIMRAGVRIGGTNYFGDQFITTISGYRYYPTIWETSPATTSGWADAEFDAMQIGYKKGS